jgi:hypothetical protein
MTTYAGTTVPSPENAFLTRHDKRRLALLVSECQQKPDADTFTWWRRNETRLNVLKIAYLLASMFSIPATSVSSERVCLLVGNIF